MTKKQNKKEMGKELEYTFLQKKKYNWPTVHKIILIICHYRNVNQNNTYPLEIDIFTIAIIKKKEKEKQKKMSSVNKDVKKLKNLYIVGRNKKGLAVPLKN